MKNDLDTTIELLTDLAEAVPLMGSTLLDAVDHIQALKASQDRFKSMQDISPLWIPVPLNLLPDTQGMSTEEMVELMSNMIDKFDVVPRDLTSTR